jgi:hypothetical protein
MNVICSNNKECPSKECIHKSPHKRRIKGDDCLEDKCDFTQKVVICRYKEPATLKEVIDITVEELNNGYIS